MCTNILVKVRKKAVTINYILQYLNALHSCKLSIDTKGYRHWAGCIIEVLTEEHELLKTSQNNCKL